MATLPRCQRRRESGTPVLGRPTIRSSPPRPHPSKPRAAAVPRRRPLTAVGGSNAKQQVTAVAREQFRPRSSQRRHCWSHEPPATPNLTLSERMRTRPPAPPPAQGLRQATSREHRSRSHKTAHPEQNPAALWPSAQRGRVIRFRQSRRRCPPLRSSGASCDPPLAAAITNDEHCRRPLVHCRSLLLRHLHVREQQSRCRGRTTKRVSRSYSTPSPRGRPGWVREPLPMR